MILNRVVIYRWESLKLIHGGVLRGAGVTAVADATAPVAISLKH